MSILTPSLTRPNPDIVRKHLLINHNGGWEMFFNTGFV